MPLKWFLVFFLVALYATDKTAAVHGQVGEVVLFLMNIIVRGEEKLLMSFCNWKVQTGKIYCVYI